MTIKPKPVLAICIDWFVPGYKAGGPIRSIVNLARLMQPEAEIRIFTGDRDHGDTAPFPGIRTDCWVDWEQDMKVWYASPDRMALVAEELRRLRPATLYLNGMFSLPFTIRPLLQHLVKPLAERVVLAPRGMLREGAVRFGARKKRIYFALIRLLGIHKQVIWQATDAQEVEDVKRYFGEKAKVVLAGNVPTMGGSRGKTLIKHSGSLRLVSVSRIHPIKHVDYLLERLGELEGTVGLDLIGPVEDEAYWVRCQEVIRGLPGNVTVRQLGSLPHHEIMAMQGDYHLFALCTAGENFGHAIFDALVSGLPVLISDQTPWNTVNEQGAGRALPLARPEAFREALQEAINWDQAAWESASGKAKSLAETYLEDSHLRENYLELFFD